VKWVFFFYLGSLELTDNYTIGSGEMQRAMESLLDIGEVV